MPPGRTSRMLISARRMRAADDRGGAVAVAQRVEAAGGAELAADRAVQHDQDGAAAGGGGGAVQQEFVRQHGGEGGQHDGEMHRQAAGHDGVDRQFFRGDRLWRAPARCRASWSGGDHRPVEAGLRPRPRSAARSAGRRSSRWRGTAPAPRGCRQHRRSSRRAAWPGSRGVGRLGRGDALCTGSRRQARPAAGTPQRQARSVAARRWASP